MAVVAPAGAAPLRAGAGGGAGAYARGFGLRDAEAGRPATPDTAFGIASVAKPFTALAVLLLEEAGILAVGDSVRRWLPEFRLPGGSPQAAADAEAVTLHHLLTHTKSLCVKINSGPIGGA